MSFKQYQKNVEQNIGSNTNEYREGLLASAQSKYCVSCRFQIPSDARFCSQCGRNQNEIAQDPHAAVNITGEGYHAPPPNPQPVIMIKPVVKSCQLPYGVHKCQESFCGNNTTLQCHTCHKWMCQPHLRTIRAECNTYPMICQDCQSARNCRYGIFVAICIIILVVVFVISGGD